MASLACIVPARPFAGKSRGASCHQTRALARSRTAQGTEGDIGVMREGDQVMGSRAAAMRRRDALIGAFSFSATVLAPAAPALANPFDDFAAAKLARQGKLFMGPLALSMERLAVLQKNEASMSVEELAAAIAGVTLDCNNPRGPLAAYSNVRDVCTMKILVRSVTIGPAQTNAKDSEESINAVAALKRLLDSYDELAAELTREAVGGSREAAFDKTRGDVRGFAGALLAAFRLPASEVANIQSQFPELFPNA